MPEQNFTEEITQVWDMVKESFRDKNGEALSETAIDLWFGDITVLSYDVKESNNEADILTLGIPSDFKHRIVSEKYLSKIKNEFTRFLGFDIEVILVKTGSATDASNMSTPIPAPPKKEEPEVNPIEVTLEQAGGNGLMPVYNFEYTFENFIVGSTNKFAHAACISVANNPATNYNPLFIYGNSGLGKTHLMCAIINRMKKNNPDVKIIYTKGEDFTNQMIACLANKTMEDFRDKYRKCDVLLIDDIQFIAGKVSTQEEFFHTFNALFEDKKQIILTSDRPPRDIKTLEDRLKSRFEWGLLADIEPPDLELRIAIIKKKAEQVNITLPNDVLTFLGENLRSNIRQIEGAIKKLAALSFLSGRVITLEVARDCISELLGGAEPVNVTVDKIFSAVYRRYGISKEELTGKKRTKEIANARHITIFLIRELTEMSYPNIGKMFDRDHATVISSYNTIYHKIYTDSDFSFELNELKKDVTEG